jgi:hypothetical protein
LFKDVGDVREELWNPLLVRDPKYFQHLATILAKTKTESIRKLESILLCALQCCGLDHGELSSFNSLSQRVTQVQLDLPGLEIIVALDTHILCLSAYPM